MQEEQKKFKLIASSKLQQQCQTHWPNDLIIYSWSDQLASQPINNYQPCLNNINYQISDTNPPDDDDPVENCLEGVTLLFIWANLSIIDQSTSIFDFGANTWGLYNNK